MNLRALSSGLLLASCLVGCAPKSTTRWEQGIALANQTQASGSLTAARTVRVTAKCILKSQGRTMRFETILVADSTRGRIEAIGPFGMNLATIVWQDSTWQVWLPAQGALVRGKGDSLSLPVVGMRTLRPRELVGPYLGYPLPIRSGVPLRTIQSSPGAKGADPKQAVVLPAGRSPSWSATLDRATGLPRILQLMRDNQEVERIRFGAWKTRSQTPVPDSIVRVASQGQELTMLLQEWTPMDNLPPGLLELSPTGPVDTILVVHDGAGRQHFRVQPAAESGLTESAVDSLLGTEDLPADDATPDDPAAPEDEPELEDGEPATSEEPDTELRSPGPASP